MSDHQTKALRELLRQSETVKTSQALDAEILLAAQIESELVKQQKPLWNYLLAPIGTAGNVIASTAVTALVFTAMAWIVSLPESNVVFTDSAYPELASQTSTRASELSANSQPHDLLPLTPQSYSADEVLLELSLPSVTELIKSMEFVAQQERAAATIELISALADINALIGIGRLDDARERYFDLRDRCYACQLPRTLEALALNNVLNLDSG